MKIYNWKESKVSRLITENKIVDNNAIKYKNDKFVIVDMVGNDEPVIFNKKDISCKCYYKITSLPQEIKEEITKEII